MKEIVKKNFMEIMLPILLLIHLIILFTTQFTAWPEMLNWPYLMLNGFAPYRDIAIAHNPLMLFVLTGFYKLFGIGVWELKIFTYMVIVLTDILLFYVMEKLHNPKAAIVGLAFYIPWQIIYGGNGLWFDLFLTPLILTSYYFVNTKRFYWAGVFWALAFLTKQTAFWFLFSVIFTIYTLQGTTLKGWALPIQSLKQSLIGIIAVFAPFLILLISFSLLTDYYFWAIKFGIFVLPRSLGQVVIPTVKQFIYYFFPFTLFFCVLRRRKPELLVLGIWALAGIMSVYPRFELFHFQPAIPFLALSIVGFFSDSLYKGKSVTFRLLTAAYIVISLIVFARFLKNNVSNETRFLDKNILETAEYIKTKTEPLEKTYFLNAWESYYYFTNTLPVTRPLVPHLSWYMEQLRVQENIIKDLEIVKPKYIFVGKFGGGELSSYIPGKVYGYITSNYETTNIVNGVKFFSKND